MDKYLILIIYLVLFKFKSEILKRYYNNNHLMVHKDHIRRHGVVHAVEVHDEVRVRVLAFFK